MASNLFDTDTEVDMALTALSLGQQPDVQRLLNTIDKLQEQVEDLKGELEDTKEEWENDQEEMILLEKRVRLLEKAISQAITHLERGSPKTKPPNPRIRKVLEDLKSTRKGPPCQT